ncbi:formate dehydrogenase accessory protein FdhE [Paracoccus aurantiacus]|uniref:Protein FdhE homolog n=1 Tax=Paracoccus aurantiacus TaxID=2599412 RepID=A0A5C6S8F4_9RHOB|nr:formate dehydrogenase accessory protein FdhE [Paracoccus aurantiacus]TXB70797.1 formate dehydrogenase accessory protein FdhE [Paracoccus aurantiacus]
MSLSPDPSVIGGVSSPKFARVPKAELPFARRATRLRHLAKSSHLAPYLRFLADLAEAQQRVADTLGAADPLDAELVERNRSYRMPPLDRAALIASGSMKTALGALVSEAAKIDMPAAARAALEELSLAPESDCQTMLGQLSAGQVPEGLSAHAVFAAAALQVVAVRQAAAIDAQKLVPISVGTCPACGGQPGVSMVTATQHQEGARYACCATCATEWNEVRVKCLCCGSTKGISYRAIDDGSTASVIKAEVCDECHSWVKILYQNLDTALEPVADDVASLGLDALMRDTEWKRGGFNAFLSGY